METIKTGMIYRQAEIGEVSDDRQIELAFSSEEPVERSFGVEVLDHDRGSINMEFMGSGRAPLLVDHDPTDQVGVVDKASLGTDRVARATGAAASTAVPAPAPVPLRGLSASVRPTGSMVIGRRRPHTPAERGSGAPARD